MQICACQVITKKQFLKDVRKESQLVLPLLVFAPHLGVGETKNDEVRMDKLDPEIKEIINKHLKEKIK